MSEVCNLLHSHTITFAEPPSGLRLESHGSKSSRIAPRQHVVEPAPGRTFSATTHDQLYPDVGEVAV